MPTYFNSQPGFISAHLDKGIGASGIFINYTVWELEVPSQVVLYNEYVVAQFIGYRIFRVPSDLVEPLHISSKHQSRVEPNWLQ
jgi:hypothetical protein